MGSNAVETYRSSIERDFKAGIATEHTYRPALKNFLESIRKGLTAFNDPKREACGAPDFVIGQVSKHGPLTVGYVETKDFNESLDAIEKSEQLRRYRSSLHNLVLTNYVEFRWYIGGEPILTASLGQPDKHGDIPQRDKDDAAVLELLTSFLEHEPEPIKSAKALAERLARLTHLLREVVVQALDSGKASSTIEELHVAFRQVLIPDLSVPDFADMFAQTIAYGLFAARVNTEESVVFRRQDASKAIPRSNPFLRRLFSKVAGPDLDDEPFVGLVDDLAQLLDETDIKAVLKDFGKRTRRVDPIVHFYETFLAAYDPALREMRGVYYTPESVVSYIVSSVDELLKSRFDCSEGLADTSRVQYETTDKKGKAKMQEAPRVLILDPACGTGTFLATVITDIRTSFEERDAAGKWRPYVSEYVLPRLFGFELLVAPYAVAHLKLGMLLAAQDMDEKERSAWGYEFQPDERLDVYLTNSLEKAARKSELLFGQFISDEANAASEIKQERPIMVVLGNPPYSGHSANKGTWISELVADYKKEIPGLDKPAQAKWLQDDYVKFIRFGQWRIDSTGCGILAFITNHGYLENPTFRGMRRRLMESFSEIYILNLHGSLKKKEIAPDAIEDKNVFDIQQGVAIGLFVKKPDDVAAAKVFYKDLWGSRPHKYEWLNDHSWASTEWTEIHPEEEFFLFVPRDTDLKDEFEIGMSLRDIMNETGDPAPGIVTTHDQFAISWTAEEAKDKIQRFLNTKDEDEARSIWKLCSQEQWNYDRAKKALAKGEWESELKRILYHPFDWRWTVFDPNVAVHRRLRIMKHMLSGSNLALATTRAVEIGRGFEHALCTRDLIQHHTVSSKEVNYLFPLYVMAEEDFDNQGKLELSEGKQVPRHNLSPEFVELVQTNVELTTLPQGRGDLDSTVGPEDLFAYIYAILHSRSYRSRYTQSLRLDFPRIPVTTDIDLFRSLVTSGTELIELHLLESPLVDTPMTSYPVSGSNIVEPTFPKFVLSEDDDDQQDSGRSGRLYISKDRPKDGVEGQYFDGVPEKVWNFHIGGYQVCDRWLRDRQNRELGIREIDLFEKIVVSLNETIRVMDRIEEEIPGWPLP